MKNGMRYFLSRRQWAIHKTAMITFIIMCFSMSFPGMVLIPAAFASELTMGEEATLIYSKGDLQSILNNIKGKLMADFPATTELSFLEDIRNELNRQLAEVEMRIEEDLAAMPDIPGVEFNTDFDAVLDSARRMIYMLDNIIINPTIDQIDSALELIEILDPEVQGEILATKPELPNRTADMKSVTFKTRPVKDTGASVTEADLAETAEIVFTDTIIAKALELNHDVVDIFTWVKFNIDYEPYYGSMKGSNETLVDMAGNDCDTSSLLLALLRTSGIPSRYVRGAVELKIEDLMNWTGGKTPKAAVAILQRNKIPTSIIYKFDAIEGVVFDHIWVEAFDGHNWRLMDPSFKIYVYTEGVGFDISEEDVSAIIADSVIVNDEGNRILMNYDAVYNQLETQAVNYETSVGHLNADEVFGKREIFISEKNNLPPYLARGIIGDRKPAEEFSTMPEDMQVQVKVTMPGDNKVIMPLAIIAGKRVSLVYVAAYASHQAHLDFIGGIYNLVWPYTAAIRMKPVLQIDGEPVAEGAIIGLAQYQYLQIGFLRPGIYDPSNPVWEESNKPLLSGNRYNISITTQRTSLDELSRLGEEALIVAATEKTNGLTDTDQITDDMIDESLRMAGMFYFGSVDKFSDYASKRLNIVSVSHVSMGYICDEVKPVWEYFLWFPLYVKRIDKAGLHIDVVRNVKCPTSTIGNRSDEITWMEACGLIGTNMEHAMIEAFYNSKAVSTGMIFAEAAKQGIEIHVIRKDTLDTDLAAILAYNVTKNHIRSYVNAGYIAMIPQCSVSVGSWSGQGWLVLDEETGAAGYMICGGLHGETTMVNGGSGTTIIDHPLSALETALWLLVPSAGAISAGLAHIVAALEIFYMYPLLGPFCLLGMGIGLVFIAVALVTFIAIFSNYPLLGHFTRRRRYAYV